MKQGLKTLLYLVNIVLYLVVIAVWLIMPEELLICLGLSAFNLIFTGLMIIWDRERVKDYYMSSHFSQFAQTFIASFLILCILGLVNYLAYKNPKHIDTTFAQRNSLTQQTHQVLSGIEGQVSFDIYARNPDFTAIRGLVELYRLSHNNIELNYIDVELRPDRVQAAGVKQAGTIIVRHQDRQEIVEELSELALTNALVRLTRERDPSVYFVHGLDGLDLSDEGGSGLSHLAEFITKSNYDLRQLSLLGVNEIPASVDTLVLWGPEVTLETSEVEMLRDFLDKGGNLIVGINPNLNRDMQPQLRSLLKEYGIKIRNDLVIDQVKKISGSDGTVPLVDKFDSDSPLEKDFNGHVFFPLVSSVVPYEQGLGLEELEKLDVRPAFYTTHFPASWAEQSMDEVVDGNVQYTEGEDLRGPISLAATVEKEINADKTNRIVVFGNTTFTTNNYSRFEKNFQLFLNAVSWASGEDRLISLNVPVLSDEPVFISSPQLGVIFYFSVVFAPLGLFGLAFLVYRRRMTT